MMRLEDLRSDWWAKVNAGTLRADLLAGLTGATLVLPQSIAFAAIAGLPPQFGIYTAIITTAVAALAGSSWQSVSGPATAISALVFAGLSVSYVPGSQAYISAAIVLAFMVGLMQIALALARMGVLVDFVSHAVMTGFVGAAAILIGLSQISAILGVELPRPSHLDQFLLGLFHALPEARWQPLITALTAILVSYGVRRWQPLWPNYLIGLIAATGLSLWLGGADADIATVGAIDAVVPRFSPLDLNFAAIRELSSTAAAIAFLGLLEALSIARALAARSGQMVDANREFFGQGLSNAIGGLFQCFPGSASFTRSALNYDAGAVTPLAAVFSSAFLLLIVILLAPWFAYVPNAGMAGVILLVAWRLIDVKEIKRIASSSRTETAVAVLTFATALLVDLEFSIYAGVILSLVLFLRTTSRPSIDVGAPDPATPNRMFRSAGERDLQECPQLLIVRIDGPLYFGSVEFVRRKFRQFESSRPEQKHMLFIIKGIGEVDMPGADLIIDEGNRRQRMGGSFHLQTRGARVMTKLARFAVMRHLGRDHIHMSKRDAIAEIVPELCGGICQTCQARVFRECEGQPGGKKEQPPT